MTRVLIAAVCAALLLAAAGCGGDDQGDGNTGTSPSATAPQQDGGSGDGSATTTAPREDPSSPDDRRLGSELRQRLQGAAGKGAGFTGADVVGVEVGRTAVVVRTKLGRGDSEAASTICAEMRRYLAQEPSSDATATVTVVGGGRAVITAC